MFDAGTLSARSKSMSNDAPPRRGILGWLMPLVLAFPLIYVLSFGPAVWGLVRILNSGMPYVSNIAMPLMLPYIPLVLLGHRVEAVGDALNWYVRVFEPSFTVIHRAPIVLPPPASSSGGVP
jgi:hypothetical protein